jgi:hypothetical protein
MCVGCRFPSLCQPSLLQMLSNAITGPPACVHMCTTSHQQRMRQISSLYTQVVLSREAGRSKDTKIYFWIGKESSVVRVNIVTSAYTILLFDHATLP